MIGAATGDGRATDRYWVVGGEYTDTRFAEIVGGGREARHGPFASYDEARVKWAGLSMAHVDNAHMRFRIEREGARAFWVVGARYTDTSFTATADGAPEERLGPFASEDEARAVWRKKAWESEEDGLVRWRVERR